jgi:hypothetical protein
MPELFTNSLRIKPIASTTIATTIAMPSTIQSRAKVIGILRIMVTAVRTDPAALHRKDIPPFCYLQATRAA